MKDPHLFICIPCINELEYLPKTIYCIQNQDYKNFTVIICVNQPDSWWNLSEKINICKNNVETLKLLSKITDFKIKIIDYCNKGKGWKNKEGGVGWARKVVMDAAIQIADTNDILISLDSDTQFNIGYFSSIVKNFRKNNGIAAISVPYYHKLIGNERADRAILRYEIYMRNYALNLFRINNPYCFTALGSAMAIPIKSYNAVGGMTPKHSGEDFYFLMKLRKYGPIQNYNSEKVYPAARFSDRVFFGTGPAMIKGDKGDWESYPIYHYRLFDKVKQTFDSFPDLFIKDIETPMSSFLYEIFNTQNIWQPLRDNFITEGQFVRACSQKVDALRILQFLKLEQKNIFQSDEKNLIDFFNEYYPNVKEELLPDKLSFSTSSIETLNKIRDFQEEKENVNSLYLIH
jgi:glycosyltransferase involved in cell wall biosynthesis